MRSTRVRSSQSQTRIDRGGATILTPLIASISPKYRRVKCWFIHWPRRTLEPGSNPSSFVQASAVKRHKAESGTRTGQRKPCKPHNPGSKSLGIPSAPPAEEPGQRKSLQQLNAVFIIMASPWRISALGEARSSGWNARRAAGTISDRLASAVQPQ